MALKFNPTTGQLDVVLDKASEIKNTPSGNLAATTVQAALNELQGDIDTINTDIADDVEGPASSTDEAIARFDGTTGKLLQNSSVTITDAGVVAGATQLNVDNLRVDGNTISSTDTNGNIALDPNGTGVVVVDDLQTSGSQGIVLRNSSGTQVAGFGPANTTNISLSGNVQMSANSLLLTGSIASTGSRVTKGWFTDLEVTNAIAGSITGNAATVTTNANLTGDITSTGNATAIASGVIVNSDVNASAAIAVSKLAATTASRALVSDASGFLTAATTTSTEIGYVNGVTSAIQTQLNTKDAIQKTIVSISSNVTLTANAIHLVSTAAARNVTLPSAPSTGTQLTIKDVTGSADVNNITIVRAASETIEGVAASYVMDMTYQSVTLISDASGNWWII